MKYEIDEHEVSIFPDSIGEVNKFLRKLGRDGELILEVTKPFDGIVNGALYLNLNLKKPKSNTLESRGKTQI